MEIRCLIMSRRFSLRLVEFAFILCSLQISSSFAILPATNLKARQNLLSSPPFRMRKASFAVSAKAEKKVILTEVPLDRQPVEDAEEIKDDANPDDMNEQSRSQSDGPKLKRLLELDCETVEKIPSDSEDSKAVISPDEGNKVDGPTERKTVTPSGSSKPKKQKSKEIKEVNQKEALKSDESPHLSSRNGLAEIESEKVEVVEDLAANVLVESVVNENVIEEGSVTEMHEVNSAVVSLTSEIPAENGIPDSITENTSVKIISEGIGIEVENEKGEVENDGMKNIENLDQVNEDIAKIKMFVGTAEFWDPFTSDYYPAEDTLMANGVIDQEFYLGSELFDIDTEKKKEKKKNVLEYVETFSFGENIEEENDISQTGSKKNKNSHKHKNENDKIIPNNSPPLESLDAFPAAAANIDMRNILLELEEKIVSLQDLLSDEKSRSLQLVEAFLKIEMEHETLRAEFLQYKIMALELTAGKDP